MKSTMVKVEVASKAAADVLAERKRQRRSEGWTLGHDDMHGDESLAAAAACYAMPRARKTRTPPRGWPASWGHLWWKPKDRRRDLVRAAALLIAEIERLDRLADR